MRLAINIALSLGMLALCLWLVWPDAHSRALLADAIAGIEMSEFWPYLAGYLALMAVVHFCRSYRWNNLLAPIGVRLGTMRLLAISSVGFLAILALPARLGEFVRPSLIRQKGHVSASAALGTVAVERVVDGLLISLLVFVAFFSMRGDPDAPSWMMPTAYAALGVFAAALVFLIFALKKPEATVDFALAMSLLPRLAPKVARVIREKLLEMIRGLSVLRDRKNMLAFLAWSVTYWTCNGLCVWLLARAFGLDLSIVGGFAVMGLVGVGITLPNAPGLFGQYQWFTMLGLSLYLGPEVLQDSPTPHPTYIVALAFANVQYALQVIWYVAMGALGLASSHVSFADLRASRKLAPAADASDDPAR
jgi:uncharacterized protein (TIRG00374 family)